METLEKSINDFFSNLDSVTLDWISTAKKSIPIFPGIKNLFQQIRILDSVSWPPDLVRSFPDIEALLRKAIVCRIEEEITKLVDISKELSTLKNTLKTKFFTIEKNAYKLDLTSNTNFGELAPPVYKFIEYAEDVIRHYSASYIDIEHALVCLDYKDCKTVESLENAFESSLTIGRNINDIVFLWKALQNG